MCLPFVPVGLIGTRFPPHRITWRLEIKPRHLTWTRSSELAFYFADAFQMVRKPPSDLTRTLGLRLAAARYCVPGSIKICDGFVVGRHGAEKGIG